MSIRRSSTGDPNERGTGRIQRFETVRKIRPAALAEVKAVHNRKSSLVDSLNGRSGSISEPKKPSDDPDKDKLHVTPNRNRRNSINTIVALPRKSVDLLKAYLFGDSSDPTSAAPHSMSDSALIVHDNQHDEHHNHANHNHQNRLGTQVPFTKWTRKLYGSEKAVEAERERMQTVGKWLIHPMSRFRVAWDVISTILVLLNIVIIPADIAFTKECETGTLVFNLVSDVWFMIDIGLNFRTAVHKPGCDISMIDIDPKKIRNRYLRGWFTLDFIASFPFDLVAMAFSSKQTATAFRLLKFGRLLSLTRAFRLPRLYRCLHQWEEIFNLQYDKAVSMFRMMNFFFFCVFICHFNGCILYVVPALQESQADSWLNLNTKLEPNSTVWQKWSWSFFKSTSHMLCIGYSQVKPRTMGDLWATMFSQFSGAILWSIIIGNAIVLLEEMDATKHAYRLKVGEVHEYMHFRHLPSALKIKIFDFFELRYNGKYFDEKQILEELSPGLRKCVLWNNCATLIHSVVLFEEASDEMVEDIAEVLVFNVYNAGQLIAEEGTKATHMVLIGNGDMLIETHDGNFSRTLNDGMYFGEGCLMRKYVRRAATVTAISNCQVYLLYCDDYRRIAANHPKDHFVISQKFHRLQERSSLYDFLGVKPTN